jgi:ParB family chromosome partitioning protein
MAQSISDNGGHPLGLMYPLIIQPWTKQPGFNYKLLAGFRRMAAVRQLHWTSVPCKVMPDDLSKFEADKINYIENLERKDLNIVEEARGIQKLFPHGESVKEIAHEIRRDTEWVRRRVLLSQMPIEVQKHFESGRLVQSDLNKLTPWVSDPFTVISIAKRILDSKLKPLEEQRKVKNELFQARKRNLRHPRRTKAEMSDMISYLWGQKPPISGLHTRILAWCSGSITTEELKRDIETHIEDANE